MRTRTTLKNVFSFSRCSLFNQLRWVRAARGIARRRLHVSRGVRYTAMCTMLIWRPASVHFYRPPLIAGGSTSRGTPYRSIIIEGTWSRSLAHLISSCKGEGLRGKHRLPFAIFSGWLIRGYSSWPRRPDAKNVHRLWNNCYYIRQTCTLPLCTV